jgi:hypothetical protein
VASEQIKRRDAVLQQMSWAFGTLKSAVGNVNIGEGVKGCEGPVEESRATARQQIERLRRSLDALAEIL